MEGKMIYVSKGMEPKEYAKDVVTRFGSNAVAACEEVISNFALENYTVRYYRKVIEEILKA